MWEFVSSNTLTLVLALVVLACPLMHVFGHRHQGRGDGGTRS